MSEPNNAEAIQDSTRVRSTRIATPWVVGRFVVSLAMSVGFMSACGGVTSVSDERQHRAPDVDSGASTGGAGGSPGLCFSCGTATPPNPTCGNGVLDQGELCDGVLFRSTNCVVPNAGATRAGKLRCTPQCQIEFLACSDPRSSTPCSDVDCAPPDASAPTCDVRFCPTRGFGASCCLSSGVCGVNYGMGCVSSVVDGGP